VLGHRQRADGIRPGHLDHGENGVQPTRPNRPSIVGSSAERLSVVSRASALQDDVDALAQDGVEGRQRTPPDIAAAREMNDRRVGAWRTDPAWMVVIPVTRRTASATGAVPRRNRPGRSGGASARRLAHGSELPSADDRCCRVLVDAVCGSDLDVRQPGGFQRGAVGRLPECAGGQELEVSGCPRASTR
jgi:hypothetical protein